MNARIARDFKLEEIFTLLLAVFEPFAYRFSQLQTGSEVVLAASGFADKFLHRHLTGQPLFLTTSDQYMFYAIMQETFRSCQRFLPRACNNG
jgi:hypothetical protein